MNETLAIRYRPHNWDDVVEQDCTKAILKQQLDTNTFKHAYLFTGSAGCGKTTCARIFANDINKGVGTPIEMDGASHNSVDDIREISNMAQTKPIVGDYKVFIIDEIHALSSSAFQAMLKLIEEPPTTAIFIFCTTNPEKIPATILSRVQRYNFKRISTEGIKNRLKYVVENDKSFTSVNDDALEYIAKLADGGMRDALSMLDKCKSYSKDLTVESVVDSVGTVDYDVMFKLLTAGVKKQMQECLHIIDVEYQSGKDMKTFLKQFTAFVLDVLKYQSGCEYLYLSIPNTVGNDIAMNEVVGEIGSRQFMLQLLRGLVKLNSNSKWSSTVKEDLESMFVLLLTA